MLPFLALGEALLCLLGLGPGCWLSSGLGASLGEGGLGSGGGEQLGRVMLCDEKDDSRRSSVSETASWKLMASSSGWNRLSSFVLHV